MARTCTRSTHISAFTKPVVIAALFAAHSLLPGCESGSPRALRDAGAGRADGSVDAASTEDGSNIGSPLGGACDADATCDSGYCVDGVCCDLRCDGGCQACVAALTGADDGQCAPVRAGEDPADACDAGPCGSGTCDGHGACALEPAGTTCRVSAGACDVQEVCDGLVGACPADALAGPSVVCREVAGGCDLEETCDGLSRDCPVDSYLEPGATCRPAAGPCDVAEACDGASPACPADSLLSPSTVCRPLAGPCDATEFCTGQSRNCPSDAYLPAQTPCADAENACDLPDVCSGSTPACVDRFQPDIVADCAPFRCATTAPMCRASCSTNANCAPGAACLGGSCTPARRVFVTSTLHPSDLGGLAGADAICQSRAEAANLVGNYRAWLSDGTTSAASRLEHFAGPYYRVLNGVSEQVAASWNDLTDGTLERTLGTTEFGAVRDRYQGIAADYAWTGSSAAGASLPLHCAGWAGSTSDRGAAGNTGATNSTWSDIGGTGGVYCYHSARLYCLEQASP